jgi:hypothetical protein
MLLITSTSQAQYEQLWKAEQENNMLLDRPQVVVRADAIGGLVMAYTNDDSGDTNVVVKALTPQGATRWTAVINDKTETVVDVIIDLKFNNYILGHYDGHGFIAKVDSTGDQLWFTELKQSSSSREVISAFALRNDTLVIVGSSTLSGQEKGLVISVSANSGSVLNSAYYNGGEAAVRYLDVAFDETGKSFACGYMDDGGNYDAILHAYNKNITSAWTANLQTNAGVDIAYGVCTDLTGNVFSTGCYTQSSNTKIFTSKYSTSGTKKWVNTYDTEGEDRGLYIHFNADTIAVAGFTQPDDAPKDVITLSILTSGATNWYQVFSGNEGLDDYPTDVRMHEGSVIVPVTGHVVNDTTSALVLLYRSANGNSQHTHRPTPLEGVHTKSSNIDVDPMGNVLLAYDAENVNTTYHAAVSKLNRFGVNQKAIQQTLKMLAVGCLPLRTNTAVKEIIHNRIGMVVDSFAQTSVRMLIAACARDSIFIEQEMDAAIAAGFNWADSITWTQIGIKRLYYKLSKMNPMLYVDNYYAFADTTFINATPPIAYTYLELDYPFNVVTTTNGTLTKSNALSFPSWNIIAVPAPWQQHKMDMIFCLCDLSDTPCKMCDTVLSSPVRRATNVSGTQNHEIGIYAFTSGSQQWTASGIFDTICYRPISLPVPPVSNNVNYTNVNYTQNGLTNYMTLWALHGYDYWDRIVDSTLGQGAIRLRKVNDSIGPIESRYTNENGWSMTLCHNATLFNDLGENLFAHALAMGGVYRIVNPIYNTSYYFAFPYARGLWFSQGPDLNFALNTEDIDPMNDLCSSGEFKVSPNPLVGSCELCRADSVFNYGNDSIMKVLLSPNLSDMDSYWRDNVLTIGFRENIVTGTCIPDHIMQFHADTVQANNCDTSGIPSTATLIQTLNCYNNNEIDVIAPFVNQQTLQVGDTILVHAIVNFQNGEQIENCNSFVVQALPLGGNLNSVTVELRGKLAAIVPNQTYRIRIYKL